MQPTDDRALLRAFAENQSDDAFATLVARHVNLVYSVALRHVGNAHHAEEITQAVFIILAKKAVQLRHHQALASWLFQATRLTATNFVRSEVRRHRREQEAYMQSILDESAHEIWPHIAPLLDGAVAGLREKERQAIVLRFYEGRNLREIGLALGTTEAAAEKRVSRALDKLRQSFTKRGLTLSRVTIAGAMAAHSVQAAPAALASAVTAVAITKGATASGSTLTLIKGALKIMAWTKMKTAVVVGVSVLLAAGTTTLVTTEIIKKDSAAAWAESIWEHPDSDGVAALEQAPPVLMIRPTHFPQRGSGIWTTTGRCVWVNANIHFLVGQAYDTTFTHMILPGLPSDGFDYLNTLPAASRQPALQSEMKKRFGLVAHKETRETEVLLLQVKDPARLQRHRTKGGTPQNYGTGDANTQKRYLKNVELSAITSDVEGFWGKPTLNRSGTTEHFDFFIQWTEQHWTSAKQRMAAVQAALANQLDEFGLELVPSREPIEMLVVEKVK